MGHMEIPPPTGDLTPSKAKDLTPIKCEKIITTKPDTNPKLPSNSGAPPSPAPPANAQKEEKVFVRDPCFAHIDKPFGLELHIFNRYYMAFTHVLGFYMLYLFLSQTCTAKTYIFETFYGYLGGLGITMGVHRLWAHKTYKAKTPLKVILMIWQTIANEYPIFKWALEHRIHHKYTDTEADPHNSKKGFWWSHIIWIFYPRTPELQKKWKTMDMSDLESDPIIRFQSQYYWPLVGIFHYAVPMTFVYYYYQIPLFWALGSTCLRYVCSLHFTWTVNSIAHKFGTKPYDKNITPVQSMLVAVLSAGEGWHNYHHSFPWDYKASEFPYRINISTLLIDMFAKIGWAYDMKMVSKEVLAARVKRTGDGSHWTVKLTDGDNSKVVGQSETESTEPTDDSKNIIDIGELQRSMETPSWGWGDPDLPQEWRSMTTTLRPEKSKSG